MDDEPILNCPMLQGKVASPTKINQVLVFSLDKQSEKIPTPASLEILQPALYGTKRQTCSQCGNVL